MRRLFRRLAVLLLLLALWVLADQHRLTVSRYTCGVRGLDEEFDGLRIVQLSDLHGAEFGKGSRRLLERVAELEPDLIALTGDFVGKQEDLAVTAGLLPALRSIAPLYYVSGNHEWGSRLMKELEAQLEESGAVILGNRWVKLRRGGGELLLCGVEDPNSYADLQRPDGLIAQLREQEGEGCCILLGHRNDWIKKYPALDVDLILCGHCHGGVIRLPLVGGLLSTEGTLFPEYDAGLFQTERYSMLVSRGLGSVHHIPRVLNPPEIVLLTLQGAEEGR